MKDEELKQLAMDIEDGLVFTTNHVPKRDMHLIPQIFMPLIMGALEDMGPEGLNKVGMLFEYLDNRGPRTINGYPIFNSVCVVPKSIYPKLRDYALEYREMRKKFAH